MQSYLFNTEVINAAYAKSLRDEGRAEAEQKFVAERIAAEQKFAAERAALLSEIAKLKGLSAVQ